MDNLIAIHSHDWSYWNHERYLIIFIRVYMCTWDKIHVVSIPKYHKCLTSFSIYFYHDFIVFIIIVVLCTRSRLPHEKSTRTEETKIFYLLLLDTVKIKPITDCLVPFCRNTRNECTWDTIATAAATGTGTWHDTFDKGRDNVLFLLCTTKTEKLFGLLGKGVISALEAMG